MICFINRSTVDFDIRLNKYVMACKQTRTPYFVIGWDRLLNASFKDENEYHFKVYSPYTKGKKLIPLLRWLFFVWYYLIRNFNKYKVIHACNMENILFVLPFKLLGKKIIFDVYDTQKPVIERKIIPMIDVLILPHEKRIEPIGISKNKVKRLFVVENVPALDYQLKELKPRSDNKIHLSYVGTFQTKYRGLEETLEMVKNDDRFIFDIAGTGEEMEPLVKQYAKECDRIIYHGKVLYSDALELMHNSDFMVALYYTNAPVHKYASPNKFHESLFLRRPIITSLNTLVGERVLEANSGYVVADTVEALLSVFDNYGSEEYMKEYNTKVENCKRLWDDIYKNYRTDYMEGEYIDLVRSMQ